MTKKSYYLVNGITLYRLLATPVLFYLVVSDQLNLFKWLIAISFFTDAVDGYLARKYHVVSKLGAKLDSIADDFTILAALFGLYVFKTDFVKEYFPLFLFVIGIFLIQTCAALYRYGKISSFHTYLAKIAAVFQAVFLILAFFLQEPYLPLFYCTIITTAIELAEEVMLVFILPKWQVNVKGLYWVIKSKRNIKL